MIYVCEQTLDLFRRGGWCDWCRAWAERREPDHVFTRGAGRLDIRIALAGLCRDCHQRRHDGGEPSPDDLLLMVAQRERTRQDDIRDVVYLLRRLDKNGRKTLKGRRLADELAELRGPARELAFRVFREMGKANLVEAWG